MTRITRSPIAVAIGAALMMTGCATTGMVPSTQRNVCALIGAVVGGGAGAAIGNQADSSDDRHRVGGGAIGAVAGGALGYLLCRAEEVPNQPPRVRASAEPLEGEAPLTVSFRSTSEDVDGRVVEERWDFGDGAGATGASATHEYTAPGRYTARFTATDDQGLSSTTQIPIRVSARAAEPRPTAQRIVLRGVNFDFDSAVIRSDADIILETAAEVLRDAPGVRVSVRGHTDSTGPEAYNQRLSERRAQAVRQRLIELGISDDRLVASGAGESEPVADNGTPDGRAQNRRVELNVIE